jgi:hypothetical protein
MKNLLKAMANISRTIGGGHIDMIDSPTFRMSMKEYEDMGKGRRQSYNRGYKIR